MRVLIAGCGYVGRALARLLAGEGHSVWGLTRSSDGLPAGVAPIRADVTDPSTLRGLPDDLDAVVYAVSPDDRSPGAYRRAYVEGPGHVLDAALSGGHGPGRFLLVSSTGVYDESDGGWVDETTAPGDAGATARVVLSGEAAVRDAGVPSTIVRLGGIYGPGRTRLIDRVKSGEADCAGAGRFTNRIHRDDAARALGHLLAMDEPEGLYLGVDREPAALGEVLSWIARRAGTPDPCSGSGPGPRAGRRGTNKRCSSARLTGSGFGFRYPTYREGYGALLEAG